MAVTPSVSVDISLVSTGVSRAGFGTMTIIGAHRWFSERTRSYTSLTSAAQDLPSTSLEYVAIQQAFEQTPSPAVVKIGRREADAVITPEVPETGKNYTITVAVNDGDSVVVDYDALITDTSAEDIVDVLKAAIDGDANVAAHVTTTKTGTGASAVLEIAATTTGDFFVLSDVVGSAVTYTTTESAADLMTAIELEDLDYYAVASTDHTDAFVIAMADQIEARDKMYFVSSGAAGSLTAYSETSTDTLAKLRQGSYLKTASIFHEDADTEFPEVAYFSYNAPYDAGGVSWTNVQVRGLSGISKDPATGNPLSDTQRNYLDDRNTSWVQNEKGVTVVKGGRVASGAQIDDVRGTHMWAARLEEGLTSLLVNQQGTKIGYNDFGISKVYNVMESVSTRLLSTEEQPNLLDSFEIRFPTAAQADPADRAAGILRGTFTGYLTGAVSSILVTGTLTYQGL